MEIELRFFAMVREAIGERTLTWEIDEESTVRNVLAMLEDQYPALEGTLLDEENAIAGSVTVMRNGTNVTHFEGAGTELTDGDRLSITPPVTGG